MANVVGKKDVRLFIQLHRIFLSCFGENPLDKAASVFRAIVNRSRFDLLSISCPTFAVRNSPHRSLAAERGIQTIHYP